jgi:hypothetical protein
VVRFGGRIELPAHFATLIKVHETAQSDAGQLVRSEEFEGGMVCGYRYSNPPQEQYFLFARPRRPISWTAGAWASDADFLYWSVDRVRKEYMLVLCNGCYADARGRRVLTCSQRVRYAEVLSSTIKVEIFSSDAENVTLQQSLDRVGPMEI